MRNEQVVAQLSQVIEQGQKSTNERLESIEVQLKALNGTVREHNVSINLLQREQADCRDDITEVKAEHKELQNRERDLAIQVSKWSLLGGGGTVALIELIKTLLAQTSLLP